MKTLSTPGFKDELTKLTEMIEDKQINPKSAKSLIEEVIKTFEADIKREKERALYNDLRKFTLKKINKIDNPAYAANRIREILNKYK